MVNSNNDILMVSAQEDLEYVERTNTCLRQLCRVVVEHKQ